MKIIFIGIIFHYFNNLNDLYQIYIRITIIISITFYQHVLAIILIKFK